MRCSLIIPAYNSEKTIAACLESALKQSLPQNEYEIIAVDDGSTDKTLDIIRKYPAVRLIQQANQGPASARNHGADKAKGSILVFSDSDCKLDFNFLEKIISPIEKDQEIVGVQGSYQSKQNEFMARFGQIEIEARYRRMAKKRYTDFIGSYAAAYRKDVFDKHNGFDTGFPLASGEDTEFSYKLHKNGYKMVFDPEAFVYHNHPSRLWDYLRSKFYRGFWRIRLYKKHPQKTMNDSYTPQSLKFQVLCIPLLPLLTFSSKFNNIWLLPLFMILLSFIFYSIPFIKLFRKKKYAGSIYVPLIIFLRALSIFGGIMFGIANEFRNSRKNKSIQPAGT